MSKKKLLPKAQEVKLKKFGFYLSLVYFPDQINYLEEVPKEVKPDKDIFYNWAYAVVCNQHEPIEFLLKNRISFTSCIHYGHAVMKYDGENDRLLIAQNYGNQCLTGMGSFDTDTKSLGTQAIKIIKGKQYLKENK